MKKLLADIQYLKDDSVKNVVDNRVAEFEKIGEGSSGKIFKELCFCLLTANFNAERGIEIQNKIGEGFLNFPEKKLAKTLRALGYRYPNIRAKYIVEARKYKNSLKKYVGRLTSRISKQNFERQKREWVVENIKGLGYKEGSHFLRNIGYKNLAIIDFHIVDLLVRHGLAIKPTVLTRVKYLEIENLLTKIADSANLNLAELDLYLWYMETGKVLK